MKQNKRFILLVVMVLLANCLFAGLASAKTGDYTIKYFDENGETSATIDLVSGPVTKTLVKKTDKATTVSAADLTGITATKGQVWYYVLQETANKISYVVNDVTPVFGSSDSRKLDVSGFTFTDKGVVGDAKVTAKIGSDATTALSVKYVYLKDGEITVYPQGENKKQWPDQPVTIELEKDETLTVDQYPSDIISSTEKVVKFAVTDAKDDDNFNASFKFETSDDKTVSIKEYDGAGNEVIDASKGAKYAVIKGEKLTGDTPVKVTITVLDPQANKTSITRSFNVKVIPQKVRSATLTAKKSSLAYADHVKKTLPLSDFYTLTAKPAGTASAVTISVTGANVEYNAETKEIKFNDAGDFTITASDGTGKVLATLTQTVKAKTDLEDLTKISFSTATITKTVSETDRFSIDGYFIVESLKGQLTGDDKATYVDAMTWTSSNPDVAYVELVDKKANVTVNKGTKAGKADITATYTNAKDKKVLTATLTINVIEKHTAITSVSFGNAEYEAKISDVAKNYSKSLIILPTNYTPTTDPNTLIWESDNLDVAYIVDDYVYFKAPGTANITVKVKGNEKISATMKLTVKGSSLKALTVDPQEVELTFVTTQNEDYSTSKVVEVIPQPYADDYKVTWATSNEKVAIVGDYNYATTSGYYGVITATGAGDCVVTATVTDGTTTLTKDIKVKVNNKFGAVKIKVPTKTIRLIKGEKATLTATANQEDLVWASSDKAVATVKNGVITAKAVGTCRISATTKDGSQTDSFKLHVRKVKVNSVTGKKNYKVKVGNTVQLSWSVAPDYAYNKAVKFTSADKSIAKVSTTGVVTGVSAGKTTVDITPKYGKTDVKKTVTITVTK